jgi:hypothetical protein
MTIASANTRVRWAGIGVGPLVEIVVASIALVTGICPAAAAKSAEGQSTYAVIPAQLSMGRPGPASTPGARKRTTAPAKPEAGLTPQEQERLAEAMNRLTPEERKRLAKAVKRLTPEQRRQLVAVVKRQLAKKGTASQLTKRAR